MDLSDINLLKRIDAMDANDSNVLFPERSNPRKNSADDIDEDDEDDDSLDDLLYDDDDDPPKKTPKKTFLINSPKSLKPKTSESPLKKSLGVEKSFGGPDEFFDEIKGISGDKKFQKSVRTDELITSRDMTGKSPKTSPSRGKPTTSSPKKSNQPKKNTLDLFLEEEEKYLGDLGLDKLEELTPNSGFSNEKSASSPQKPKLTSKKSIEVDFDEDNDILDSLDNTNKQASPSKNTRQSFMDDLLGKETTKASVKKLSSIFDNKTEKTTKESDKDDIMVFGGYVPSAASTNRSSGPGRRQSVLFKSDSPISLSPVASPSKGSRGFTAPERRRDVSDATLPSRRSQADHPKSAVPATDAKTTDIFSSPQKKISDDWLDFPKKDSKSDLPKRIPGETRDSGSAEEEIAPRRKSSGVSWLGLGEESMEVKAVSNRREARTEKKDLDDLFNPTVKENQSPVSSRRKREQLPWMTESSGRRQQLEATSTEDPSAHDKAPSKPTLGMQSVEKKMADSESVVKDVPLYTSHPSNAGQPGYTQQPYASFPVASTDVIASQHSSSTGLPQPVLQTPAPVVVAANMPQMNSQLISSQGDASALQAQLASVQFERDQLLKSSEMLAKKKEEDLKLFEANIKNQQKAMEDSVELRLKSAREGYEADVRNLKEKLSSLEQEKKQQVVEHQSKIDHLERDHHKEVLKVKELHNEAMTMLKQNHEDSLARLKRLKDQEIEAISSTQLHTRSLQSLSDQLEERASELAALQRKVEEKHQFALQEREALLISKEKDLKTLEARLHWQMEEGEQERARLQQLVLRLEKRLQQQTKEGEEDHWETLQLKTKLEVQRKFLDEEKKLLVESVEMEKEKLRVSQNAFLHEQKTVLVQLAQERQQLTSERQQFELLAKRVRDEEGNLVTRKLKEESSLDAQKRLLDQENEKVYLEKQLAKQEALQLQTERQALEREKRHLNEEKEKLNDTRLELKRKSDEVEVIALRAASDQEEGRSAIVAARRTEADHRTRMNEFTQQIQMIMEKQKELMQEREKFNEETRDFEKTKASTLCVNCKLAVGLPMTALPPSIGPVRHAAPMITPFGHSKVDPSLMVWYVSAEKDREYIQEELSYLKSLKELEKE